MDHLACFAAGMYGLAAHEEKDENSERWMEVAKVRKGLAPFTYTVKL